MKSKDYAALGSEDRDDEALYLLVKSDSELVVGRKLRQLLVDLLDDSDFSLLQEDQVLLLIFLAVLLESFI
jgi:hypothetical protein